MAHRPSNRMDLARQHIELVGERYYIGAFDGELAFADHVQ